MSSKTENLELNISYTENQRTVSWIDGIDNNFQILDNTIGAVLKGISDAGLSLATSVDLIDDFGSGYSSLNLLKDMNSDVLKLDRAFFGKDKLRKEEQIIVSSIVDMAKKLDIKVLSEGVETQEQSDFLKEIECDLAQGYLFSKPIPREELEKILNTTKVL